MSNPNKYRRKGLSMDILNTITLKSNRQIKINFNGGDLSSDAGLLLIKEFAAKIGFTKLIKKKFKTNDTSVRFHKDDENLMQMIYQIISAYFEDDCADELTIDPVFNAILEKNSLASQPTLSRFFNRMDKDTLLQFDDIDKSFRDIIYSIKCPEHMLLDLDSTLFVTYGNQEVEGFNFHYQAHGYHPLLCYDGLTGDLLKQNFVMEHSTAAMMQINLWNPFFRNIWKEASKHTFVVTVDSHLPNFIKPVR